MSEPNLSTVVSNEPSAVTEGKLTAADVFNMVNEIVPSNEGSLDYTDPFTQQDPFELLHKDEEGNLHSASQQQAAREQIPPVAATPVPATPVAQTSTVTEGNATAAIEQSNQPTPEQIAAQNNAAAQQNAQFLEALGKHYSFDLPEDSSLPPEVKTLLPEYAKKIHLSVVQQMQTQFAQSIDQIVESRIAAYNNKNEVVNQFKSEFPQINLQDANVAQTLAGIVKGIDSSGKKFNTPEERRKMIGATACLVLGLDPTAKPGTNVTNVQANTQPVPQRNPQQNIQSAPVVPIRANGGAANSQSPEQTNNNKSDIDSLFDMLSPIMRPR